MARIPIMRSIGRAARGSGALRPLAIGVATSGGLIAAGYTIQRIGEAKNPPLQVARIDTNGDGKPDSTVLADPRTGGTQTYGAPPTHEGDNDRSDLELGKTALWVGGLAAAGLAAVLILRGS